MRSATTAARDSAATRARAQIQTGSLGCAARDKKRHWLLRKREHMRDRRLVGSRQRFLPLVSFCLVVRDPRGETSAGREREPYLRS